MLDVILFVMLVLLFLSLILMMFGGTLMLLGLDDDFRWWVHDRIEARKKRRGGD